MLKPISACTAQKLTVIDRLIIRLGDTNQPSLCILQEQLPLIFRITAIEVIELGNSHYEIIATIFNEKATLNVQWYASVADHRLALGRLVAIRWKGNLLAQDGNVLISRLIAVETPNTYVNLLDTIPISWYKDEEILHRMRKLFELFSDKYKSLFNVIFWNNNTLYELISSSSFMHTVERCEQVMKCEYKFFIDIEQTVLMLLINASNKRAVCEVIIQQIVEAKLSKQHRVNSDCWATLLMSLNY